MEIKVYVWLVVLWIIYFTLHSLLANEAVKRYLLSSGISLKTQRIIYNIIATLGLLFILFYNGMISSDVIIIKNQITKVTALFLGGAGVLIINAAFRQFRASSFAGFTEEKEALIKSGILKHIRHPLYAGTILLAAGFFVFDPRLPTLISVGCIYLYLPIGIFLEEKKLIKQFGQLYIDYKKEVPALIPKIKLF